MCSKSGPEIERTKNHATIIQLFKSLNLKITTECTLAFTDFLDVSFDLQANIYKPFSKTNNTPQYINAQSNHPTNIKKDIPSIISKRVSTNSCNNQVFRNAAPIYNKGLNQNGYSCNIKYTQPENKKTKKPENTERKQNMV